MCVQSTCCDRSGELRMKQNVKLKGILGAYLNIFLGLGIVLAIVDVLLFVIDTRAGLLVYVFLIIYYAVLIIIKIYTRSSLVTELVNFATQYGQIQRKLLRDLELPHALLDDHGKIIWMNKAFEEVSGCKKKSYQKSVSTLFADITKETLPVNESDVQLRISHEEHNYLAKLKKIPIQDMVMNSEMIEAKSYDGCLIALYLFDETELDEAKQLIDDSSVVIGLIYLDNYDEVLESVEEVRRSLLIALVDRKVNKYIGNIDGITKKIEKDKYLILLNKKSLGKLQENKFNLLEEVKTVNIGNDNSVTLSIGIGLDAQTFTQNYEYARTAIDLALGRGGDQAIVKTSSSIIYYGGKSQQVDKNTRVKARVKAHALKEIISAKDDIIVMGHRMTDVDSFGSAVGIYCAARGLEKKAHIVINEVSTSLKPLVALFKDNSLYDEDMLVTSAQALELVGPNTVLVIVDVNRPSITECPELLTICKSIVVLDHHRQGEESIENATLSYVEPYASSACEMVAEILQYIDDHIRIYPAEADCMYSGIMIDTNNFMAKTGVRTFEAAAFLKRSGADVTRVRKMFREGAAEYKAKAIAIHNAETYDHDYAITVCPSEGIESPTIVGAQAANELLDIVGIKASFVLTEYNDTVYVSARSIDEVNVQIIMEQIGGGGHLNIAGAQLDGVSVEYATQIVKETLKRMKEGGDI